MGEGWFPSRWNRGLPCRVKKPKFPFPQLANGLS